MVGAAAAKLAVAGTGVEKLRLLSGALGARRAKFFLYGFLFAFVACTAYLAFNPNTPAAPSPFFARFFSAYTPSSTVSGGNETAASLGRSEVKNATAKMGVSQTSFNQSRHDGDGGNATGSGRDSRRRKRGVSLERMKRCDLYDGNWVKDVSYPLYGEGSCPLIDEQYDCFRNGRRDKNYLKYRWQPNGCNIPRLNATDMLERLRGRRMVFVGDSLNRNMWESLVCILRNSVRDKRKVFEVSGRRRFHSQGAYSFIFQVS